jgi:hypothetical protein
MAVTNAPPEPSRPPLSRSIPGAGLSRLMRSRASAIIAVLCAASSAAHAEELSHSTRPLTDGEKAIIRASIARDLNGLKAEEYRFRELRIPNISTRYCVWVTFKNYRHTPIMVEIATTNGVITAAGQALVGDNATSDNILREACMYSGNGDPD